MSEFFFFFFLFSSKKKNSKWKKEKTTLTLQEVVQDKVVRGDVLLPLRVLGHLVLDALADLSG